MRVARPLVAVALSAAVLSGCSVAGTDFHPGVAAQVGDTRVTSDEVDRVATATCDAFGPQLVQDNQVVPMRYLKSSVLQAMTLEGAAREFGRDQGVVPSEQYTSEVSAARTSNADLPPDQLAAVVLLRTNNTLVTDIAGQVGAEIAADSAPDAVDGSTPAPASDEAQKLGLAAFGTWLSDHDVTVDPQYDVEITAAGPKAKDTSVAYAVSELSTDGSLEQPDLADTMKLPALQRCGRYLATTPGGAP